MIDNIEQQVSETRTYVQKGNEEIKTSIQHQKSIRKKQWYVIVIPLDFLVTNKKLLIIFSLKIPAVSLELLLLGLLLFYSVAGH